MRFEKSYTKKRVLEFLKNSRIENLSEFARKINIKPKDLQNFLYNQSIKSNKKTLDRINLALDNFENGGVQTELTFKSPRKPRRTIKMAKVKQKSFDFKYINSILMVIIIIVLLIK